MIRKPSVLAIDDDTTWLFQIPVILEDHCDVTCCSNIDQGLSVLGSKFFDIVLLDMNFEGDSRSGLDVFRLIQAADKGADVIVISGETAPQRLVQIINAGVAHFLPKPVTPADIRAAVESVMDQRSYRLRAAELLTSQGDGELLIGKSIAMRKLREQISQVIQSGVKDILLTGETGTGKEVVARAIAYSADPSRRFIPIHCGAISDGIAESELFGHVKGAFTGADRDRVSAFEAAGGGFVFFDEIGDMPIQQQAKILRVLQERKVQRVGSFEEKNANFRTISATNVDLENAISQKQFREDLYYRIAKARVKLPALRDRIEDIPELTHHFIAASPNGRHITITQDALDLLKAFHWPGNVRQLKSVIESICANMKRGVIRDKEICHALPQVASVFGSKSAKILVSRYGASIIAKERDRFEKALLEFEGDRDRAAISLNLSRATFYRRAKELGLIKERRFRSRTMDA